MPRKFNSPPRIRHELDAASFALGRLATRAASLLMGKHKPAYSPNRDIGDFVTVVHGQKLRLSGKKMQQKKYFRASGHGGGIREYRAQELVVTRPELMIRHAIAHMLPNNRLRAARLRRLSVVA